MKTECRTTSEWFLVVYTMQKALMQRNSRCGLGNGPRPVIEKPAEHVAPLLVVGAIRH
jgi:hypothetical protein